MTPSQADYLDSLPFTLTIPHRRVLVVHAGVVPGNPLPEQNLVDLYQMRDLKKKGHSWVALELATADTTAWAKEWKGEYHIFFGHDAKRRLQFHRYATGLDSGCCYGGQLTACILPRTADVSRDSSAGATREALGAEMVSVQAKKDYREK
ncbi:unnamed protein product [Ostreobium quekettii]|uniref:Uncharacterized protein n=1 Tax=Ostreobium quekettii TaxID=121088 RepID=A0A8S1IS64_9CHLO|nr:unnamed protein product [Ostreobium quekettii]|eukprot:evm.model.scf_934EXC.5 EVM.evm.TU.scf_934EXC.5   scf_934EXC:35208-35990(-)